MFRISELENLQKKECNTEVKTSIFVVNDCL